MASTATCTVGQAASCCCCACPIPTEGRIDPRHDYQSPRGTISYPPKLALARGDHPTGARRLAPHTRRALLLQPRRNPGVRGPPRRAARANPPPPPAPDLTERSSENWGRRSRRDQRNPMRAVRDHDLGSYVGDSRTSTSAPFVSALPRQCRGSHDHEKCAFASESRSEVRDRPAAALR